MKRSITSILPLCLACGAPTGPIGGQLSVRTAPPLLELTNESPAPVYSFTIERQAATYTDWVPCTDAAHCAAIKTGAAASVPYTQIVGYAPGAREAIVYWWHLVPSDQATFQPDTLRAIVVTL
jgi:hypothetical protein